MILLGRTAPRILLVALFVLACDQLGKALVINQMSPGERIELLSFLSLERTSNSGIAFGLAGGVPPIVLILVAVAVVVVLLLLGTQMRWRGSSIAIGLILGGALGNLADRVFRGSVIDYIDLPHWPTFNLADIAITIGVIMLIVGSLRSGGKG